jgi:predicted AlkP superfamily pyrophosphatase or phosphodiesterase
LLALLFLLSTFYILVQIMLNTKITTTILVMTATLFLASCTEKKETSSKVIVPTQTQKPKLILQITVDALRGDLISRFGADKVGGGFRYLIDNGINYRNANYQHANTETIVGHVSLATGTVPALHGMIANVWFDRKQDRLVYNIEDSDYSLLTEGADVDKESEIDPTQRAANSDGRSPRNILTSTFSDELAAHNNGQSKIFAVSVKDRGAVSLAGQSGKAFWFSKKSGQFVTSNYYYDSYPAWVIDWNNSSPLARYVNQSWTLTNDKNTYQFSAADDQSFETDFPGFGRTFPHAYGNDKYFSTRLTLSPAGDEITLDFAKTLITNEQLGQDNIMDYLAISFSSTDYVGHMFGASSLESEENILRLNKTLGDLLAFVDKTVGMDNTLIVLSADHGQPEVPGYLHGLDNHQADPFDKDQAVKLMLERAPELTAMQNKLADKEELISAYFHPYIYLNKQAISNSGQNVAEVEEALIKQLEKLEGVAYAVSSVAVAKNALQDDKVINAVENNYNQKRSGDIYLVFEPNVFISDMDGLTVASTHGSPWRYDTFVPVIFAGMNLKANSIDRPVTPYDIATTLSAFVGVKPPSGSIGEPLIEVLAR